MISARLSDLILLCMIPGMLTVGAWWMLNIWRERKRDTLHKRSLLCCRICGCNYPPDPSPDRISHCPSCHSANLHEPQRQI